MVKLVIRTHLCRLATVVFSLVGLAIPSATMAYTCVVESKVSNFPVSLSQDYSGDVPFGKLEYDIDSGDFYVEATKYRKLGAPFRPPPYINVQVPVTRTPTPGHAEFIAIGHSSFQVPVGGKLLVGYFEKNGSVSLDIRGERNIRNFMAAPIWQVVIYQHSGKVQHIGTVTVPFTFEAMQESYLALSRQMAVMTRDISNHCGLGADYEEEDPGAITTTGR